MALRKEACKDTRQSWCHQGLAGIFALLFPYVFPLQIQNILYKTLHPGGAVLLHPFCEVAVFVQGKSSSGVSHICLHGLNVISGSDSVHSVGVAQIVEPDTFQPGGGAQRPKSLIYAATVHRSASVPGEHKAVEVVPHRTGFQLHF